jgi:ferric-chelate reductase
VSLSSRRKGGRLAVCASGPEGLIEDVANALARIQLSGISIRLRDVEGC